MNKKQRKEIAQRLATIAGGHGAVVEMTEDPKYRCTTVDADFGVIKVSIDVDDAQGTTLMAHWHSAQRRIIPGPPFNSVNTSHFHKATQWRDAHEPFIDTFRAACEAVAKGEAFEDA